VKPTANVLWFPGEVAGTSCRLCPVRPSDLILRDCPSMAVVGADVSEGRDPFDFGSSMPAGAGWTPAEGAAPPPHQPDAQPHPGYPTSAWPPPVVDPPPFGGGDFTSGRAVGRPPIGWLVAALAVGATGAVLAGFWGAVVAFAVAGWLLSGPAAIGLLAVFTQQDVRERAMPLYLSSPGRTRTLYAATTAVAALGIGLGAWYIAQWAGRL
jgi:hypothetical protein